jgi:hypothetical protein
VPAVGGDIVDVDPGVASASDIDARADRGGRHPTAGDRQLRDLGPGIGRRFVGLYCRNRCAGFVGEESADGVDPPGGRRGGRAAPRGWHRRHSPPGVGVGVADFDAVERGTEAAGKPTQHEDPAVQLRAGVAATGVAQRVAGSPLVGFMVIVTGLIVIMVVFVGRYVHNLHPRAFTAIWRFSHVTRRSSSFSRLDAWRSPLGLDAGWAASLAPQRSAHSRVTRNRDDRRDRGAGGSPIGRLYRETTPAIVLA